MAGGRETESFIHAATRYWRENGSTVTVVRRVICGIIDEKDEPFDAEILLGWARTRDPQISISSVYRTVSSLEEAGLLIGFEGDERRMHRKATGRRPALSHIICSDCGLVVSIDDPCLGLREVGAAKGKGFSPEQITLRMVASCDELEKNGRCEKCVRKK